MQELFEGCGLLATFIATLLEGEVFFITAIISSKLGAFSTTGAIIAGFLGSYVQGWFKYYVAKIHGNKLLLKSPKLNSKISKNAEWFDKNPVLYLTIYKFMFGLTTVVLVLSGLRNMSYYKFAIYSAISSLIWVIVFGFAGYFCADLVLNAFETIGDYRLHFIGALIIIGLIVFYVKHRKHLKHCIEVIADANTSRGED